MNDKKSELINLQMALDEFNLKAFDFYRNILNPSVSNNVTGYDGDTVLNFVENELKWNTPEEFEELLLNTQKNHDLNHEIITEIYDEPENAEDIFSDFTRNISEISRYIRKGNFSIIPQYIENISSVSSFDFLNVRLNEFDIDIEELLNLLYTIIGSINLDENYDNPYEYIPRNIKELNEEIIYQISRNPELIYSLEPRLFEELIEKILKKFGIQTKLTKQTRDGGYDILAIDDTRFSKNQYLIECKRYKPENKVDVSIVRGLYGVKMSNQATKGLLITSSSFTKDAEKFAKQHAWELELFDYNDIVNWLKTFWK